MTDSFIYGLIDPRTREVRYIGKSARGMQRPLEHSKPCYLRRDRTHKANWIRELQLSIEGRASIARANRRAIRDTTTGFHYISVKEAAEVLGLCQRSICCVLRGKRRQTRGHVFVYSSATVEL